MYKLKFYEPTQCMMEKVVKEINNIGYWYVIKKWTYIINFGAIKEPIEVYPQ
jgi:hypothetical protein